MAMKDMGKLITNQYAYTNTWYIYIYYTYIYIYIYTLIYTYVYIYMHVLGITRFWHFIGDLKWGPMRNQTHSFRLLMMTSLGLSAMASAL